MRSLTYMNIKCVLFSSTRQNGALILCSEKLNNGFKCSKRSKGI